MPWQQPPHTPMVAATREQAAEFATHALEVLDRSGADGQAIFGEELNRAIDALRRWPAIGVRCASPRCNHGMAWVAIDEGSARAVSANRRRPPKGRQHGGIYDLLDITPGGGLGRAQEGWVEDANANKGSVRPTGERPGITSGYNERRTHTCQRCGRTSTHTNETLLRRILEAIRHCDAVIRL